MDKLDDLERRVYALEADKSLSAERHSNIVSRLDKIDGHINKLVWLLVASIVGGFMTFVLQGGLAGG